MAFNFFKRKPKYNSKSVKDLSSINTSVTFDDVLLEPQYSEVETRKNVDISTSLLGLNFINPLISANMDTVTETEMAIAMNNCGGLGILHRYQDQLKVIDSLAALKKAGAPAIFSVGVGTSQAAFAVETLNSNHADAVCVDIAHGDSKQMVDTIKLILSGAPNARIIAGNVATYDGAERLLKAGAKAIKVGIGPGAVCTTRRVTGHGVPQISAISEVAELKKKYKFDLIADGGCRDSGDVAKALAFGADMVMLGSMFVGSIEAPGQILQGQKVYRGMASREARSDFDPKLPTDYTPEGVAIMKPITGPVADTVNQICGGLRSALSYSGATSLQEFRSKARFMVITSASHVEGTPHGMKKQ